MRDEDLENIQGGAPRGPRGRDFGYQMGSEALGNAQPQTAEHPYGFSSFVWSGLQGIGNAFNSAVDYFRGGDQGGGNDQRQPWVQDTGRSDAPTMPMAEYQQRSDFYQSGGWGGSFGPNEGGGAPMGGGGGGGTETLQSAVDGGYSD